MDKKTFILYKNWTTMLVNLPDEKAGILIKAICNYYRGDQAEVEDEMLLPMWLSIKELIDEDVEKYEAMKEERSKAGQKGNDKRWEKKRKDRKSEISDDEESQSVANNNFAINENRKVSLNENENVNENDNVKDINTLSGKPDDTPLQNADGRMSQQKSSSGRRMSQKTDEDGESKVVLEYLNSKTGRHYRNVGSNLRLINARLKDGHSVEDCKSVIDKKCVEWLETDMSQYLRPETLFNATHFESYLNQPAAKNGNARIIIQPPTYKPPDESVHLTEEQLEEIRKLQREMGGDYDKS